MSKISLECPYCGVIFQVDSPDGIEYKCDPSEVFCLPYTRDIGKFDPKPEVDVLSAKCWSKKIGKDYLSFINYERIGILRIAQKGINVKYRVQQCIACNGLFDVFANYTKGKFLSDIWPHLLTRNPNSGGFKLYRGENGIIKLIKSIQKFTSSARVGALIIAILIFLLGFLPYAMLDSKEIVKIRLSDFVVSLLATSKSSISAQATLLSGAFLLFFSVSVGIAILLSQFEEYLSYIRNTEDFNELFILKRPEEGVVFWKNYISSRFVGVQDENRVIPRITQSDVFAGGIAIVLGLFSWLYLQSAEFWVSLARNNTDKVFFYLLELLVWIILIYIFSIAIFLALSLTSYVLNGIRKIPMEITPYDKFLSAKPLRVLEGFSVNIMLVSFIVILFVLSILQLVIPIQWVIGWFEFALSFLFIAIGLGTSRSEYLAGATFYLLALWGVQKLYFSVSFMTIAQGVITTTGFPITIDLRIVVLGIFFTAALAFQLISADRYVNSLLSNAKISTIKAHKRQLIILENNLNKLNNEISKLQTKSMSSKGLELLESQRHSTVSTIETTLRIIEHLEKVDISQNHIQKVSKALTPFLTSFILPLLLNIITTLIIPT